MDPPPEYLAGRIALFDKLKAEYDAEIASKPVQTIVVTLPDGKVVEAESWRTTPYEVARGIRSVFKHVALIFIRSNFSVFFLLCTVSFLAYFNQ